MEAHSRIEDFREAASREILLVEDSESDARLIHRTLQIAGVINHVRHLSHGQQAVAYLEQAAAGESRLPSILLLDLKLPGMNGFEILGWLQKHNEFSKMLRVVLSQLDQLDNIKKAYSLGAHSFLSKPIGQEEVEELIAVYPEYWVLRGDGGQKLRKPPERTHELVAAG